LLGSSIIAVNYEARALGIKRGGTHGDDAKKMCPDIHIFQIPEVRGKADLTKYRDASKEVFKVLSEFSDFVERASIDEAYIDLTSMVDDRLAEIAARGPLRAQLTPDKFPSTFVAGYDSIGTAGWLDRILPPVSSGDDSDEEMADVNEGGSRPPPAFSEAVRLAVGALFVEEMRKAVFDQTSFRCSAGISLNKVNSDYYPSF
jgi:DNA polymerase eta